MERSVRCSEHDVFVGWDWASDHHDVVVVNGPGEMVEDFRFEDTAAGWEQFRQRLSPYPRVAVAIETSGGSAVERLLELG